MKMRQNLYIDRAISDQLEAIAGQTHVNKSRLVNEAVRQWLERRGSKEIEDLLKRRLDKMTRELAGARRDIDVVLESLALFVRYQLTVTAPLPAADTAGRAVGRDRFEAFVAEVGKQIAVGKRTLAPEPALGAEA